MVSRDRSHKLAREKYLVVNRFPILLVVPFVNPPLLTHLLHPCKLIVIGRYVSRFYRSKIAFDFWRGFASVPRLIMNMTRRLNCNAGTVQWESRSPACACYAPLCRTIFVLYACRSRWGMGAVARRWTLTYRTTIRTPVKSGLDLSRPIESSCAAPIFRSRREIIYEEEEEKKKKGKKESWSRTKSFSQGNREENGS